MDKDVRWLVVTGRNNQEVERYLYSTSKIFDSLDWFNEVRERYEVRVLVVVACEGSATHAAFSQAERLHSGLLGAQVFDTYAEARETLLED